MVFNLSDQSSIALQFLFELRESHIQKDRARFRRNVQQLGQILAYEISKTLAYELVTVTTPVTVTTAYKLKQNPILITILRAGVPMMQGFLDVFDHADAGFIGAFREEGSGEITVKTEYMAIPPVSGKEIILIDPMLATGKSMISTLDFFMKSENPARIHVASVIAAPEGIKRIQDYAKGLACPLQIWTGAIDDGLNDQYYIVPGLGDAGDLSFGNK